MSKLVVHAFMLGVFVAIALKIAGIPSWTPQWWFLDIAILATAVIFASVRVSHTLKEERKK